MMLLLDHNVSYRLKHYLKDIFPEAKHVTNLGLTNSTDMEILRFAEKSRCCIISFDGDFVDLVTYYVSKVKVIWLRTGNTSTVALADLLKQRQETIHEFLGNDETRFLEIQ